MNKFYFVLSLLLTSCISKGDYRTFSQKWRVEKVEVYDTRTDEMVESYEMLNTYLIKEYGRTDFMSVVKDDQVVWQYEFDKETTIFYEDSYGYNYPSYFDAPYANILEFSYSDFFSLYLVQLNAEDYLLIDETGGLTQEMNGSASLSNESMPYVYLTLLP
jgi:hypothetical protein